MLSRSRPYVLEAAGALWPNGSVPEVHRGRPAADVRETFVAVPGLGSPRLLLPHRRLTAGGALRAYGGHASGFTRLRTGLASGAFSSGLGALVFRTRVSVRGDGISDELGRILGVPVQVALRGGPPRANRKPVLAVLGNDGSLLAFAKVGTTAPTAALVSAEGEALRRLAQVRLPAVRVPRPIHCGPWRGMHLLVQEALPVRRSRPVSRTDLLPAAREVAEAFGVTRLPWRDSAHAQRIRERVRRITSREPAGILGRAVEVLAGDDVALPLGSWHGDWTPWNSASLGASVLLWDWERFGVGVPLGLDVLHYELQSSLPRRGVPAPSHARALLRVAESRLAPFGIDPARARSTSLAYLVEIASRYLADDQAGAGAGAGRVDSWLLPVIQQATAHQSAQRARSRS